MLTKKQTTMPQKKQTKCEKQKRKKDTDHRPPRRRNKKREEETRNKKQETRNKEEGTRNKEQGTRNKEQRTTNLPLFGISLFTPNSLLTCIGWPFSGAQLIASIVAGWHTPVFLVGAEGPMPTLIKLNTRVSVTICAMGKSANKMAYAGVPSGSSFTCSHNRFMWET
jgi:hypothetical protein